MDDNHYEKGCLLLTRKIGESFVIGENAEITITVLDIKNGRARIGIIADKSVPVNRMEVHEKIQSEKVD
jgi:carbon storage regulator